MNRSDRAEGAARGGLRRALIALIATAALAAAADYMKLPCPHLMLLAALTAFASAYGCGAGIAGGAVLLANAIFLLYENGRLSTPEGLGELGVALLSAAACVLSVGHLRRRMEEAERRASESMNDRRFDGRNATEADITDTLTGIRNRLAIRLNYGRYENRYLHVIMLDLDDFSRVNDTYGAAVGDYLLKKAGAAMSEVFGPDCCYRYGGDQFLILCVELDQAVVSARVERLRQSLGGICLDDKRLPVDFSAGSVYGDCERSDDLRLMMHQAEYNLAEVRRKGGGQHIVSAYARRFARSLEKRQGEL